MGRRAAPKKLVYDAKVVAFHIVRKDVCTQFQNFATLYGLAGISAELIATCEQEVYDFATDKIAQVFESMYCIRYYKLLVYYILGLAPPKYLEFILATTLDVRAHYIQEAKHEIQFGPVVCTQTVNGGQVDIVETGSLFDKVITELDEQCTDGGEDAFTQTCRKCKSNKFVEFEAIQTRSADEGMTIEYTCKACNIKWR
jgi:DNA-directed RNA polymerase subunit M/transcription elongation factor TFIIS